MGMPEPGTVTTGSASDIEQTSFEMSASCTAGVGSTIEERGFCWIVGSSGTPTTADNTVFDTTDASGSYSNTISGLTESTDYRVRAYVVYSSGTSFGSTITVTTAAPEAPENAPILTVDDVSHSQVDLSWTSVSDATSYELERDETPRTSTANTSFNDTDVLPETEYSYRVRGVNDGGAGPWSNTVTPTTHTLPILGEFSASVGIEASFSGFAGYSGSFTEGVAVSASVQGASARTSEFSAFVDIEASFSGQAQTNEKAGSFSESVTVQPTLTANSARASGFSSQVLVDGDFNGAKRVAGAFSEFVTIESQITGFIPVVIGGGFFSAVVVTSSFSGRVVFPPIPGIYNVSIDIDAKPSVNEEPRTRPSASIHAPIKPDAQRHPPGRVIVKVDTPEPVNVS